MSMSIQESRLQFVNGLPDLPKMEVKGVILVRGPWDETPGSPGLPFDVNRSQSFPYVCRGQVEFKHVCTHVTLCATNCGLLVQGKTGGVGWYTG